MLGARWTCFRHMRSFNDHHNGDAGDYGDADETVAMVDGVAVAELPSLKVS